MRDNTLLGHYRITGKLGEGGMGEVYRAHDERLKRDVAVKVLPDALARDPERLARLEREAQLLAALDHPNIAAIFGLEEARPDGTEELVRLLAMQLVEGRPLAERIGDGPLPLEEALRIALQIAQALEAAHERGIVHRDLKPANVMVSDDGAVKLLDFGLAKAFASDGTASSPEVTASPTVLGATGAGVILGTAGYMSPEQARGQQIDRRSDIWAFGCLLYEMLTGTRTFDGPTVTDVLSGIVRGEADWDALPAETPRRIRALLRRCLRKDLHRRIQAIGDARVSIEEYLEDPEAAEAILDPATPASTGWMRLLPWGVVAALALVAGFLMVRGPGSGPPAPPLRVSIELTEKVLWQSVGAAAVLSPDGRQLAYVTGDTADRQLYLRSLDQLDSILLVDGAPYSPFFSPDGAWLGYVTRTELMKVPVTGGTPQKIGEVDLSRGATWGLDDTIVFAPTPQSALLRVPMVGGSPTALTELDTEAGELTHRWPQFLPDGRHVLFTSNTALTGFDGADLEVVDVETGTRKVVYRGGSHGRYVLSGHVLFAQGGTVFAVPFDLAALEATGPAIPVIENAATFSDQGDAQFSVSNNGTLVYRSDERSLDTHPVLGVDRNGRTSVLWQEPRAHVEPRLAPDGRRLAITVLTNDNWDIWIYDLDRSVPTRLTFEPGEDSSPVWSPDGAYVYFSSMRGGNPNLYRKRSDGSGEAERLTETSTAQFADSVSPDGKTLLYQDFGTGSQYDLETVPTGGGDSAEYLGTPFFESDAAFSPDGRWVAYSSNESGGAEIYVRPYPMAGGKWQISDAGGNFPRWADDGRQLFYRDDEGVMVVDINANASSLQAGKPRRLFVGNFLGGVAGIQLSGAYYPDFDARGDGELFVLFPRPEGSASSGHEHVTLVVNWFAELRRMAPGSR